MPKAWAVLGGILWPGGAPRREAPSISPALWIARLRTPHPALPTAPGKHSQTSRTTAPPQYLSHVPRFSVRMSVLTPDSSPLVPVCPRRPAPARLVPPAGQSSARRVCGCSPRPATRGAPWVLSPPCLSLRHRFWRAGPPARGAALGPHKAPARALCCWRRVQGRAGSCRPGCCTGCPKEQDPSSGLQFMSEFLLLRFVLCCRFCFPGSDHSFFTVSFHEHYSYELPCFVVFFLVFERDTVHFVGNPQASLLSLYQGSTHCKYGFITYSSFYISTE